MAQWVKNLPAMQETQETWVWSLGWEAPLEKEMATHSSIFAWGVPWTQEPRGLQSIGPQKVGHNLETKQQWQHPYAAGIILFILHRKTGVLWPQSQKAGGDQAQIQAQFCEALKPQDIFTYLMLKLSRFSYFIHNFPKWKFKYITKIASQSWNTFSPFTS